MNDPSLIGASPAGSRSVSDATRLGTRVGLVQREKPAVRHADQMRAFDVETGERLFEPLRVVGRVFDRDFSFTATDVADGVDADRDAVRHARLRTDHARGAAAAVQEHDR